MNVIRYLIEVSKTIYAKKESVSLLIEKQFINELEYGENFNDSITKEWNDIPYSEIRSLNSPEYLLGTTIVNDIKIFLFSQANKSAKSKNNVSVEVIVFGELDVNEIINHSYKKIKKVLSPHWRFSKLGVKHIDGSKVYIYPFDTKKKDIYSYELKVKAKLEPPFYFTIKDYIRWGLFIIFTIVFATLYFNTNPTAIVDQKQNGISFKDIYGSLAASGLFYMLTEFIIHILTPLLSKRNKKRVVINNLTSMVETTYGKFDEVQDRDSKLKTPEED